jgi:hypothetical protein
VQAQLVAAGAQVGVAPQAQLLQ